MSAQGMISARRRFSHPAAAFAVMGGPLAWFLALNVGYALADWPCFADGHRLSTPGASHAWSGSAIALVTLIAVLIALAAAWTAWRHLQGTGRGAADRGGLMNPEDGWARFLALWGVLLGCGFALASLMCGIGFFLLPRCAG